MRDLAKKGLENNAGQALIEAITAIGIIIVGVLGALAFLSTSVGLNRVVTSQYTGTYLAAAVIEEARNCVDVEGWGSYNICLTRAENNVKAMLNAGELNNTRFNTVRASTCGVDNSDRKDICAEVDWQEKGKDFFVVIEDRFYNWR